MDSKLCPYCGAKTGGELMDTLRRLSRCKNCRVDIKLCGEWTGIGYAIWQGLETHFDAMTIAMACDAIGKEYITEEEELQWG